MKQFRGAATVATSRPKPGGFRRWLPGTLPVVLFATVALFMWLHSVREIAAGAGLPRPPDLAGRPAILGEKLAQSEARARARGTQREGIAELGRLYHANGFPAEAAACWQLLRANEPNEARWCYYLADA